MDTNYHLNCHFKHYPVIIVNVYINYFLVHSLKRGSWIAFKIVDPWVDPWALLLA